MITTPPEELVKKIDEIIVTLKKNWGAGQRIPHLFTRENGRELYKRQIREIHKTEYSVYWKLRGLRMKIAKDLGSVSTVNW